MKTISTLILLGFSTGLFAQAPEIEWEKSFGGSNYEDAVCIQQISDGGYIIAGWSLSNDADVSSNHGSADYWIVRLDINGTLIWQKSLGGSGNDEAFFVQQTVDSGFIVAGSSDSNDGNVTGNHGDFDYWVVKLDEDGNLQWEKSFGGSDLEGAASIQQNHDGGFIVAGMSLSTDGDVAENHGQADYWIIKLDSAGNLVWQKSLGGSGWDNAHSIRTTPDQGFVVAGWSDSNDGDVTGNHGDADYWIVKLDASGDLVWQQSLGGSDADYAWSVQPTFDGGYVVGGESRSNDTLGNVTGNNGHSDYWIVKLTADGNLAWQKSLGGSDTDEAYSIEQTADGGYIIAGSSYSNYGDVSGNHGYIDYWIVKLDPGGNLLWQKCLGGSDYDRAYSIQQTADGGFIVGGFSISNDGNVTGNHGYDDYWIVKLAGDTLSDIAELSDHFISVFPDPVVNQLNISFPAPASGSLIITNLMGEKMVVQNFSSSSLLAADARNFSAGIYFLFVSDEKKNMVMKQFVKM